ncbi:hypothetical protein [Streptomyces sp. NPDC086766]|uniref:hypothetical protein n=1 Tax=Streptomyces sp. NPDC086766 TaxID=3365754 RepID=UPI003828B20D
MHAGLRGTGGAAFIVCSLLLTAGCDFGGGKDTSQDKDAEARSASPSASPSASATPSPLTAGQVKAALLTAAELPSGWRKDRTFPEDDNAGQYEFQIAIAEKAACQPVLDTVVGSDDGPKPENVAVRAFTKGPDGPNLLTGISAYLPDEARERVDASTMPKDCTDFTARDQELGKVRVRFQRLNLPDVGDASLGTRVRLIPADKTVFSVQFDNAVVRVGGAIVNVSMLSYSKTDQASFVRAVRASVDKATKTAAISSPAVDS